MTSNHPNQQGSLLSRASELQEWGPNSAPRVGYQPNINEIHAGVHLIQQGAARLNGVASFLPQAPNDLPQNPNDIFNPTFPRYPQIQIPQMPQLPLVTQTGPMFWMPQIPQFPLVTSLSMTQHHGHHTSGSYVSHSSSRTLPTNTNNTPLATRVATYNIAFPPHQIPASFTSSPPEYPNNVYRIDRHLNLVTGRGYETHWFLEPVISTNNEYRNNEAYEDDSSFSGNESDNEDVDQKEKSGSSNALVQGMRRLSFY
ncbi:hypothetical protein TWF694_011430 [Orbilia ellipsospora]|uniref:Uncharacterized protein n=1 Tax=Orbilia ellipsospora TaxID=2528407 RepID=A0AAV9X584_9PEZI